MPEFCEIQTKIMKKRRKIFKHKISSLTPFNSHQTMRRNSAYSESVKLIRRYHKRRSGLFAHKNLQFDANCFDISKWMSPVKEV